MSGSMGEEKSRVKTKLVTVEKNKKEPKTCSRKRLRNERKTEM